MVRLARYVVRGGLSSAAFLNYNMIIGIKFGCRYLERDLFGSFKHLILVLVRGGADFFEVKILHTMISSDQITVRLRAFVLFFKMDNTLNVQQYIQQCIHKDPSDVDSILRAPPGQEEGVWKYEHVRQFCMELNGLTLLLQVKTF